MTLDHLPRGSSATITTVRWDDLAPDEARRLRALGIDEGAVVQIAHRGVFAGRDPIAVTVGPMTVALRRAHAAAMDVSLSEETA